MARLLAGSVAYVEQAMPFPMDGKQVSDDVPRSTVFLDPLVLYSYPVDSSL